MLVCLSISLLYRAKKSLLDRMILKLSLCLLLMQNLTNSKTVLSRRKRFVTMLDYWSGEASAETQFAAPERIVINARPGSPYEDRVRDTGYLGRPSPLMAMFLDWDRSFEELGPTFSTMLGLSRVRGTL